MRMIGMIGGMSWESTAVYYRIVNRETNRLLGGQHNAKCMVYTLDFAEIEACQLEARWEDASTLICGAARVLADAGAEILVLCTNTMHKVAPALSVATRARFIHIADPTADEILRHKMSKVGLLGTRYTMEQDFYRGRLEERGLEVIVPAEQEREDVHRIIYEELCHGVIKDSSRARYQNVVRSLQSDGAQGVILGCTEIGMLLERRDTSLPLFDTTRLHAIAAVREALDDRARRARR